MFKKGFTLAEVLVTLGLVGVITAIVTPNLLNLLPDRNKMIVLKLYKNISTITQEIMNDTGYYYPNGTCIGLECHDMPLKIDRLPQYSDNSAYGDIRKYGLIFCSKMLIEDKCNVDTKKIDFTTIDSMDWTVSYYSITVDLNGEDAPNCTYQKTSCKKPDQFQFIVHAKTGYVNGSDPLTRAYLQNPNKLNNKKEDFKIADSYST